MQDLNPKQLRFAHEFLKDLNGTKAAIRAGYSKASAHVQGCDLLKHPKVKLKIEKLMAKREKRTGITSDWVLERLAEIAGGDIKDYMSWGMDEHGNHESKIIDSDKLSAEKSRILSEVSHTKDGIKFKVTDKIRALDLIGKHLGMFTDRVDHSGEISISFTNRTKEPKDSEDVTLQL